MYKKVEDTKLAAGMINEDYILTYPEEFNYRDNQKVCDIYFKTFFDEQTGNTLFEYKNCLVTLRELRRLFLESYYEVK